MSRGTNRTVLEDLLRTVLSDGLQPRPEPKPYVSCPFKIAMMLHFATVVGPFQPERARTSPAYTKFIKQLLREGLVERPTRQEREEHPGWAYQATNKGRAYVEALKMVQLPVLTEVSETWSVPR